MVLGQTWESMSSPTHTGRPDFIGTAFLFPSASTWLCSVTDSFHLAPIGITFFNNISFRRCLLAIVFLSLYYMRGRKYLPFYIILILSTVSPDAFAQDNLSYWEDNELTSSEIDELEDCFLAEKGSQSEP